MPETIYYLEMLTPPPAPAGPLPEGFSVRAVDPPQPEVNRQFYIEVGGPWQWTDRLVWSESDWKSHVYKPVVKTFVGRVGTQDAGFFEFEQQDGGNVEIVYFGLLPDFIGKGLGGALLDSAIEAAWDLPGTKRVWLHTCSDDHQRALANYRSRGFTLFDPERSSSS
ncbi:GNAT family N-acetyltransferase [Verrucomicrobiaceae bacterium R5-34]|uniref:GNAT family N-acetyltransferase n=1 Tax=Oceaniferula flava TaxID=2800421 RepID=A0AAE2SEM3_9BACT|nr:GNAT family N-acetyltransferase [Oceaniferula flavus]MBK1830008.1 GNAT family N-acetyltransferase [Verrucomicrobiaceae bacterium R5-34]MBK1855145.1 GNAT family N-acetyltransferase [Oceaniferula flavus]MBM1136451.1 GNAT family N-acetyltransferase [Oceaniferula flavus]